ncbi:MAG: ornithine carbamoyltransferase [candidate division Zixibacteria bacterium]|nr:ornithine carbamoyltransferase [candidate division Zixibacteria bacterium]
MARSFVEITDLTADEIWEVFDLCKKMKSGEIAPKPFDGKTVGCIFHKASLRTRISFETGIYQLGGQSLYITEKEIELGKRESIHDAAKVLSRYLSTIMIRTFDHQDVLDLAKYADVPIVNGLTDLTHPCQIMGDYFTLLENKEKRDDFKIAYVGDGNNITNSWLNLASRIPMKFYIGTAAETGPDKAILKKAQDAGISEIKLTTDPDEAVADADVIYTDVWASMGQKNQADEKARILKAYQINSEMLKKAKSDCLVMHCLPAERGKEITDEVMDGPHSVVFDEAENRLHIQKALMLHCMGG